MYQNYLSTPSIFSDILILAGACRFQARVSKTGLWLNRLRQYCVEVQIWYRY